MGISFLKCAPQPPGALLLAPKGAAGYLKILRIFILSNRKYMKLRRLPKQIYNLFFFFNFNLHNLFA